MQRQKQHEVSADSVLRVLDFGAVLIHYNHIQGGFRTARACRMCTAGLDGAYAPFEKIKPMGESVGVPEGDRKDEKGDSSPAPDYGNYSESEANKLLEA